MCPTVSRFIPHVSIPLASLLHYTRLAACVSETRQVPTTPQHKQNESTARDPVLIASNLQKKKMYCTHHAVPVQVSPLGLDCNPVRLPLVFLLLHITVERHPHFWLLRNCKIKTFCWRQLSWLMHNNPYCRSLLIIF